MNILGYYSYCSSLSVVRVVYFLQASFNKIPCFFRKNNLVFYGVKGEEADPDELERTIKHIMNIYMQVLSINLSIFLSIHPSICPSVCLSVYLPVCLSVCLSFYRSRLIRNNYQKYYEYLYAGIINKSIYLSF